MTEPRLEDKLHSLADLLDAPASTTARQAIGRRTRVLRRRRRARNTVLGVAVVVAVAGLLSLLSRGTDVETGPSNPGYTLPAITVDLDGWEVASAEEALDESPVDPLDGSYQVFRRPGELVGPTVFVAHTPSSDTVVPMEGQETVGVRGRDGALTELNGAITLTWNPPPPNGDSTAYLYAWDLPREEVIAIANSLETLGDGLGYPVTPDMKFGFDAPPAALPDGIEEERIAVAPSDPPEVRRVELRDGPASIQLEVADRGERSFERTLSSVLGQEEVESATVLERPAILYPMGADQWQAHVRLDDRSALFVTVTGADRATFDDILDHLEEINEKEWLDLLAAG